MREGTTILKTTHLLIAGLLAAATAAGCAGDAAVSEEAETAAAEAVAAAEAAQNEGVTFRIRLEKGQTFAFRQTVDMNQEIDMSGMQISTVMAMTSHYSYTVTDVTDTGDMHVTVIQRLPASD